MSIERILVGIDTLERSGPAVQAGWALACALDARLEVIHATPIPTPLWPEIDAMQLAALNGEALSQAWTTLSAGLAPILEKMGASRQPIEDVLHVLPGHPCKVLLDRANQTSADLLVIGPHKRRGLLDFGSTARGLLSQTPCSVWVQSGEYRPVRSLLVPIDLSEGSLSALKMAIRIAVHLGARVETLYCFDAPEFSWGGVPGYPDAGPAYLRDDSRSAVQQEYERVLAGVDWKGVEHTSSFVEGAPTTQILELSSGHDLIALGTHGRTGFAAAVLGSVAYSVLKHSQIPVLAIRHPERVWMIDGAG